MKVPESLKGFRQQSAASRLELVTGHTIVGRVMAARDTCLGSMMTIRSA